MIQFLLLFLLLLVGPVFAQSVPPTGCTTTTCTGSALPSGYLSVSGNQLVSGNGSAVRPACATFRGLSTDSMKPIRDAGFNCVVIGWHDTWLAGNVAAAFDDEFTTAPWISHQNWQSGDKWGYGQNVGTNTQGLSEGPTWWANAVVTPTAGTGGGGGGTILTDGLNLSQSYLDGLATAVHNEQEAEVPGGECFTGTCIPQNYRQGDTILPTTAGQALSGDIGSLTDKDGRVWTLEGSPPCSGGPNWWFGGIKLNGTELFCGYEIAIRLLDNGQVYVEEAKGGGWWSLTQYCEAGCTGSNRPGEGGDPGPGPNNRPSGGGATNPAILSQSNGLINLALISNPGGLPGVGTCNGGTCGTIGTIIQNQLLPGGNAQLFGYYEFSVAVPAVKGFAFQWSGEDFPLSAAFTMEIDCDIFTDASGNEHIRFVDPVHSNTIYDTTATDITAQNIIGINWQSDFLTFYINGTQVAQAGNPGGDYKTQAGFSYLLTTDASYFAGLPSPSSSDLPAVASLDYFKVYPNKPSGSTAPAGCNSLTQITSCVANAKAAGLPVIFTHLGNEVPTGACLARQQNGLWFDSGGSSGNDDGCGDGGNWPYSAFKANTVSLLQRFANNSAVIGYELHSEPLVNGSFTGTGGSSGGTGTFTINTAGQMIGPDGNVFRSYGIAIDDTTLGTAAITDFQRLLPKSNLVRLAVGAATCGFGGYTCGQPISTLETWMKTYMAKHVVMMPESHNCNGLNAQASQIDLPGEYTWYNTISMDLKTDPNAAYLWFEDGNECGHQGITRENRNVYNAVRGCPQAALSCDWLPSTAYSSGSTIFSKGNIYTNASTCTSGSTAPSGASNQSDGGCSWTFSKQGNSAPVGFEISIYGDGNPDGPASQYQTMSNVFWTPHAYNSNTGGSTNQTTVNNDIAGWVTTNAAYTTALNGQKMPSLFSETGFLDYAGVCGGVDNAYLHDPSTCGTQQLVTAMLTPTTTLELGATEWIWHFDNCCEWQTDTVDRNASPLQLFNTYQGHAVNYGSIVANAIAANSPGPVTGTGTGTGNPAVNWGGGGDTDILAVCKDVGAAVNAVNSGVILFCPGPLNNGTTLLSGAAKP